VSGKIDFEWNQKNFQAIDRFRYIEFDRDWAFQRDTLNADQYLTSVGVSLDKNSASNYEYTLSYRQVSDFEGVQQRFRFKESLKPIYLSGKYFTLDNKTVGTNGGWLQTDTDVKIKNRYLVPGYAFRSDQNTIRSIDSDSVLRSAMFFNENEFYLQNPDSSKLRYRIAYGIRQDQTPIEGVMTDFTRSDNIGLTFGNQGVDQQFQADFNYRQIEDFINEETVDQIQGRVLAINSILDRHIRSNLSLAISTGRAIQSELI